MTPTELRAARKSLGLTQEQLADVLGYSRSHVTRLERGHLEIERLAALAVRGLLAGVRPDDWPTA